MTNPQTEFKDLRDVFKISTNAGRKVRGWELRVPISKGLKETIKYFDILQSSVSKKNDFLETAPDCHKLSIVK